MKIACRELTPGLWPDLERLFGPRGASAGCWCMFWRLEKGEKWPDVQGAPNKRRFRKLVRDGKVHGALAYAGDEPVGWVSFDRRVDFGKLDRAPSLACDDAERVWSVPCFFVKPGWRGKGVADALLAFAVKTLKRYGAEIVEGYPVKTDGDKKAPAAFVYTGLEPMFAKAGFTSAARRERGKQRVRLALR
ncbi:GNAT family N-acetyltransferase [Vineibacter terrae]|uniref:GNAT family N-acetyltransferase n=1 Tax=Vineibacter terrae TaxID=2586908 RepID=UPI002E3184AB|nr:GNAT family N-acetyltransferase [Vineibacter terrae]HEX2889635.1 GNAT family N-acetyltransferase [Vineibacter terrae]